ncbi:hypothetical protein MD484_g8892, partial [Candolleomyces efflorescens]
MSQPYNITGLGDVHPRLEIRDLADDDKQFPLFIHALYTIQQPDYRPKAARFQDLGGIHGLPYERWRGDPNAADTLPKGLWGGYCNHQSVLFPVWHRPYVLALEQSIGEAAIHLAGLWTDVEGVSDDDKKEWIDAAKSLRFPYWDWTDEATETEGLPDVLKPQVFRFKLPDGTFSDPIENPLSFHNFGSVQPDGFQDEIFKTSMSGGEAMSFFKTWSRTYRWPSSKLNPIEDYIKIKTLLRGNKSARGSAKQLREEVGRLFCYPAPGETESDKQWPSIWDEFSNTLFDKDKAGWPECGCGSIEAPHNTVHLVLGGLGAMANNDYAGFDPIFYLHHCNIDRILAFWEFTFNQYWVDLGYYKKGGDNRPIPFTQPEGTWDEKNNAPVNRNTSLQPFRTREGNYWTPDQTRFFNGSSTLDTGYTYPDIVAVVRGKKEHVSLSDPLPKSDEEVHRVRNIIQTHFRANKKRGIDVPWRFKIPHKPNTIPLDHTVVPNYHRFYTFVELVGHAFNGSYSLELLHEGQVIGSFAVLTRGDTTQCASCRARKKAGGEVRGIIDIPDETLQDIVLSKSETLSTADDLVEALASAVKESITVRLVDAGGNLLADTHPRPGVQGLLPSPNGTGSLLEAAIVPKVLLRSAAAARKDGKTADPPHDEHHLGLTFFGHVDHGPLLESGVDWVPSN